MSLAQWMELAAKELNGDPNLLGTEHPYGFLKALFTEADMPESPILMPGMPGSVRGVRATMYANKPWTIRQYGGYGTAQQTNELYRQTYAQGGRGFSVAFDLPTHRGFDSDDLRVRPEVGKSGVALDSAMDFAILFNGIPLDEVSVSMTMNGAVLQSMAGLILAARDQGVDPFLLRGTIQNDPLKEFAARNTEIFGMEASMRIASDIIEYCTNEMPNFNPISISGYHYQEAGAHLHQELAFMLADGIEYVRTMKERGLAVDEFSPRLSFFYSVGIDFWGEIAKMRAGRMLWDKYAAEEGATKDEAKLLRFHSHTSGVSLQEQDPYFNIVRATLESVAAVLGGTQSLHSSSFDEAVGLPTEEAIRISRATQLIIRDEAMVGKVIDPLGGSYFVEAATSLMAGAAHKIVREIEGLGGMRKAIESGYIESLITQASAERQAGIDSGQDSIIGVNSFRGSGEPLDARRIDSTEVLESSSRSLEFVRAYQDPKVLGRTLSRLGQAARSGENLMPFVIDAMGEGKATWGQITGCLEKEFGLRQRVAVTANGVYGNLMKDNTEFAAAKTRAETAAQAQNRNLKMLLVKFGQDGHDRGANLIAASFRDIGFEVEWDGVISTNPQEAAQRIVEDPTIDVVGISSHGGAHVEYVDQLSTAISELDPDRKVAMVLGGIIPAVDHEAVKDAGVDLIFGPGTVVADAAEKVMDVLGIPPVVDFRTPHVAGEAVSL